MSHGSGPARRGTKFAMKTIVVDAVPVSSQPVPQNYGFRGGENITGNFL
jgi:hypothetical protein